MAVRQVRVRVVAVRWTSALTATVALVYVDADHYDHY